jgi:hypothetical protein
LKGHWAFGPGKVPCPSNWIIIACHRQYSLLISLGRRVCVGWNVGEMNVWIAAARLLYCFDFTEDKVSNIYSPTVYFHYTALNHMSFMLRKPLTWFQAHPIWHNEHSAVDKKTSTIWRQHQSSKCGTRGPYRAWLRCSYNCSVLSRLRHWILEKKSHHRLQNAWPVPYVRRYFGQGWKKEK